MPRATSLQLNVLLYIYCKKRKSTFSFIFHFLLHQSSDKALICSLSRTVCQWTLLLLLLRLHCSNRERNWIFKQALQQFTISHSHPSSASSSSSSLSISSPPPATHRRSWPPILNPHTTAIATTSFLDLPPLAPTGPSSPVRLVFRPCSGPVTSEEEVLFSTKP